MSQAFSRTSQPVSPNRKKGGEFAWLAAMALVLVLTLLLITAKQRNLFDLGYQVAALRNECARLEENQVKLRTELAKLSAPDRVIEESIRIGLRPLPSDQRIKVVLKEGEPEPELKPAEPLLVAVNREP